MIVKVLGQGPGAAHAASKSGGGPQSSVRGEKEPGATPPPFAPHPDAPPALFDANGDGTIENWSFADGGDSFATFTPAPPGSDTVREPKGGTNATRAAPAALEPDHHETPAAIHHAHDAYRRDGLDNAPDKPVTFDSAPVGGARPSPAPRSPAPRVSVPQPAARAPLPSTG